MPRILEVRLHDPGYLRGPHFAGIRAAARDAIRARVASGTHYGRCTWYFFLPCIGHFVKQSMWWELCEDDALCQLVRGLPPRYWVDAHVDERDLEWGEPNGRDF